MLDPIAASPDPSVAVYRDAGSAVEGSDVTRGPSRYDEIRLVVLGSDEGPETGVVRSLERLCAAAVTRLAVAGAAVTLMSADGVSGVAAAADGRSLARSELQFTTGEGPCVDATAARRPVLVADLGRSIGRWPGYASAASEAGVCAVFAFPLHVGGASFGVFEVFGDEPGSLGHDRLADALTFAQLAIDVVLQNRLTTPYGELEPGLASAMDQHSTVHQAQGMLMVALGVSLAEALVLMRSYAFSHSLSLLDVAQQVHGGDHLAADTDD